MKKNCLSQQGDLCLPIYIYIYIIFGIICSKPRFLAISFHTCKAVIFILYSLRSCMDSLYDVLFCFVVRITITD